jgi:hypothetical protein
MLPEEWEPIADFPGYLISSHGTVIKEGVNYPLRTSQVTGGAVRVCLQRDKRQHSRSVKRLVAEAFVPGRTPIFDTPILLDGFPQNLEVTNIVWRPKWFAWQYMRQLRKKSIHHAKGPVYDRTSGEVYATMFEAAKANGILVSDIYQSTLTGKGTFPTGQRFRFNDKPL